MTKKLIIINLLILMVATNSFAYKNGDNVDANVLNKLSVENPDKLIIVDFFASWCHSCKVELPHLNNLNNQIDKSDVEIIGVNIDKNVDKGMAFQKDLKINFKVVNDNKHELVGKFSPVGMPALYYIKNGKVIKSRIGAVDKIDQKVAQDLANIEKTKFIKVADNSDSVIN